MSAYDGRVVQRSRDRDGAVDLSGNAEPVTPQEAQKRALAEHHALQRDAERRREVPRQREEAAAAARASGQALTAKGARAEARHWLAYAARQAREMLAAAAADGAGVEAGAAVLVRTPSAVREILDGALQTLDGERLAHDAWVERQQRPPSRGISRFGGAQILGAGPPEASWEKDDPEPAVSPGLGAGWWGLVLAVAARERVQAVFRVVEGLGERLDALEAVEAVEAVEGEQSEPAPERQAEQIARLASVVGRLEARLAGLEARLQAQGAQAAQGQDDEQHDHAAEEGAR